MKEGICLVSVNEQLKSMFISVCNLYNIDLITVQVPDEVIQYVGTQTIRGTIFDGNLPVAFDLEAWAKEHLGANHPVFVIHQEITETKAKEVIEKLFPKQALPSSMMERLQNEYRLTIPEKIRTLRQTAIQIETEISEESLKNLRLLVHKMAGSSGTYGFPDTCRLCKQFEAEILADINTFSQSGGRADWVRKYRSRIDEIEKQFEKVTT